MRSKKDIAARVRRLRREAGRLQKECAAALGMSPDSYRHAESGRTWLRADRLAELAAVLGCSLAEILEPTNNEPALTRRPSVAYRERLTEVWDLYDEAVRDRHLGNWRGAEVKVGKVLEDILPADLECLAVVLMADCRLMQGRLVEAIGDVQKYVDRFPSQPRLGLLEAQLRAKLGDLYLGRGHSGKAYEQYRFCSALLDDCEVPGAELERAWTQKRMAQVHLFWHEPEKAWEAGHRAHEVMLKLDDWVGRSRTSYLLGWLYQEQAQRIADEGLARQALLYHREGIILCRRMGDVEGLAKGLFYFAEDYRKLRRCLPGSDEQCLVVSERTTRQALAIVEPLGDGLLRGRIHRNLGLVELERALSAKGRGSYRKAEAHAVKAVAYLECALAMDDVEMPGRIPGLHREIAIVLWECLRNYDEAMRHMERACLLAAGLDHPLRRQYQQELDGLDLRRAHPFDLGTGEGAAVS